MEDGVVAKFYCLCWQQLPQSD